MYFSGFLFCSSLSKYLYEVSFSHVWGQSSDVRQLRSIMVRYALIIFVVAPTCNQQPQNFRFFSECRVKYPADQWACFPFGCLHFHDHPIFHVNDPPHTMKNLCAAPRTPSRTTHMYPNSNLAGTRMVFIRDMIFCFRIVFDSCGWDLNGITIAESFLLFHLRDFSFKSTNIICHNQLYSETIPPASFASGRTFVSAMGPFCAEAFP